MSQPPQSTCDHCGLTVWWVASENRWNSSSNDHSYCRVSYDHKHRATLPRPRWSPEDGNLR